MIEVCLDGQGGRKKGRIEDLYCSSIISPLSSSSLLIPILAILHGFFSEAFPELSLFPLICRILARLLMTLLCSLGLELIVDKSFLSPAIITKLHFDLASPLHAVGTRWMLSQSLRGHLHPSSLMY